MPLLPGPWTLVAITLSVSALIVAFLNFRRKSSIEVRGGYALASSVECSEKYVAKIVLENRKDRPVTIFDVHLLVGHNFYILVDDFDKAPLIVKPYETVVREYGPIEFYNVSMRQIEMSNLLDDDKARKRLVLSTNHGRYVVKPFRNKWSAVRQHFRNHAIAVVRPVRLIYKDKAVGDNIKYIVEFVAEDGTSEVVLLRTEDYRSQTFKRFRLTKESLSSADDLTAYLNQQTAAGHLTASTFKVQDVELWRSSERKHYQYGQRLVAERHSFLQVHALGRFGTIFSNRSLRHKNKQLAAQTPKGDASQETPRK